MLADNCKANLAKAWFENEHGLPRAVATQIEQDIDALVSHLRIVSVGRIMAPDACDVTEEGGKTAARYNQRAAISRLSCELLALVAADLKEDETALGPNEFDLDLVRDVESVLKKLREAAECRHPCWGRPSPRELVDKKDLAAWMKLRQPWNAFILDMMSCYRCATGAAPTAWRDPVKGVYQSSFLNGFAAIYDALPSDSRPSLSTIASRVEAFLKDERKGLIVFGITDELHGWR